MAIVFDVTVGGELSNSYVSIPYADQYFENIGGAFFTTWSTLSDDDKKRSIIRATQYIDTALIYLGLKKSFSQALEFPRVEMPTGVPSGSDKTVDYIPYKVMDATLEAVKRSILDYDADTGTLNFNDLAPDRSREVVKEKVGELEVEYDPDSSIYDSSYSIIKNLLRPYSTGYGSNSIYTISIGRA